MATDETAGTVPAAATGPKGRSVRFWVLAIGAVTFLAGLLFGYDQGVISGALSGIEKEFGPSTFVIEIITSWVTLGAMVGALVAGVLADRLGRRFTLVLASVIFVVGALLEALAPGTTVLVVGRLVLGAGSASPRSPGRSTAPKTAPRGTAAGWSRSTRWPSPSASSWPTGPTTC